jgi:hypothetical protein
VPPLRHSGQYDAVWRDVPALPTPSGYSTPETARDLWKHKNIQQGWFGTCNCRNLPDT